MRLTAGGRRALFVGTILLGSFLLFIMQPLVARMALPRLGGAPAVWNSAMLVYQALLLGGFLFAAVATPTPEVTSMLLLAGSMCLLFAIAIGVCLLLDRRRARGSDEPDYAALDDDEASPL